MKTLRLFTLALAAAAVLSCDVADKKISVNVPGTIDFSFPASLVQEDAQLPSKTKGAASVQTFSGEFTLDRDELLASVSEYFSLVQKVTVGEISMDIQGEYPNAQINSFVISATGVGEYTAANLPYDFTGAYPDSTSGENFFNACLMYLFSSSSLSGTVSGSGANLPAGEFAFALSLSKVKITVSAKE